MLTLPITRPAPHSATWQIRLLLRGEPLRASSLIGFNGKDLAVFDTGLPQHTKLFVNALRDYGVTPDEITLVFNTHAHFDHSHNNSLFANARIFCSRRDREWTHSLHRALAREHPSPADLITFYPEMAEGDFDNKIVRKVFALEKLVWDPIRWGRTDQTIWLEDHFPLPAGIRLLPTPGHVPYHISYVIDTDSGVPVLLTGDALLTRDEEQSDLLLIPPHNLKDYKRSQQLIKSFDGVIVPGHDAPFDNRSQPK